MDPKDSLPQVVLLAVIVFTILALAIATVNPVIETTAETDDGEAVQTAQEIQSSGTWYSIDEGSTGAEPTVYTSRGYSINLTGASDSYVRSNQGIDFSEDDTWSVSLWARLDSDATAEEQTALSLNGRLIVTYNQTSSQWVAWYYDDGSRDSYELSVSGPNQPNSFTNIQVASNETHLNLYHNNTLGDTADLTTSNTADAPTNTSNWNGRLEEVRTFDDDIDTTTRQALVDSPIDPQTETNRTSRIMFDEPYEDRQLILFTGAELQQSNVTFADGFSGSTLSEGSISLTSDYTWNENGPQIRLLDGPGTQEYPVLYVDYQANPVGPGSLLDSYISALTLAAFIPILLILGFIITTMRSTR